MEYIDRKRQNQGLIQRQRDQEHWEDVHNQLMEVQQSQRVQKKSLEISGPHDTDEKEADEVARKVVSGGSAEIHGTGTTINRSGTGAAETTPEFQSKLESSKGGGQSLDDSTQSEMESKMGADFSGVKIHTSGTAGEMSESINAKAFTHGQDVYFNSNQSPQNKELLAHELVHTVQQGKSTETPVQRMDDPAVLEDRKKLSKKTLWEMTNALGLGYELKTLQTLFFGEMKGPVPAWRNNIIRYYLIDRAWEADKDPVPNWVEYKYVIDNESDSETLVVYTPIPGFEGREAAFGFVRWDLGLGEGKRFYRYQGNEEEYKAANDLTTVKKHNAENRNEIMGTTTKVEMLFNDDYVPLEAKTAIQTAYDMVSEFQKNDYIPNVGVPNKPALFSHKPYANLSELMQASTDSFTMSKEYKTTKPSRRGKFYTIDKTKAKNGVVSVKPGTLEGYRPATSSEIKTYQNTPYSPTDLNTIFSDRTTLGFAKTKFIDGTDYSPEELTEEGIGSNMRIRHFSTFKEKLAKAVFFIETYGDLSDTGKQKAAEAAASFVHTIIFAYKYPEDTVDFSSGEALLNEAFGQLYSTIYAAGGLFDKRVEFAKTALVDLKSNPHISFYSNIFKYIDEAIASKKPSAPSSQAPTNNPLGPVDVEPLAKIETALGMMDVLTQVGMFGSLNDARISTPNASKYEDQFSTIVREMDRMLGYGGEGDGSELQSLISRGRGLITEPAYGKGLEIDLFLDNLEKEMERDQLIMVAIAATVVSFWAGGILGELVAGLVGGVLYGTGIGLACSVLIGEAAGVLVAAYAATAIQHAIMEKVTGQDMSGDFEKDFWFNVFFFGVAKIIQVVRLLRSAVPATATPIGKGIWRGVNAEGATVYYVEKGLVAETNVVKATGGVGENLLAPYKNVRAALPEVQNTLKAGGQDPHLIENALRRSNKSTLEYFEQNPTKLTEAAGKLAGEIPGLNSLAPVLRLSETTAFLDGFVSGGGRVMVRNMSNVYKATAEEITVAAERINLHRQQPGNKAGNYGYLEGEAGGVKRNGEMVGSGPADNIPELFDAIPVNKKQVIEGEGAWLRNTDSEYKLLNRLANDMGGQKGMKYPEITGEIKLISERKYCPSCQGVIQQFNTMYPKVRIILIDGIK